ncbi:MAG: histone deacetylase [Satyrvirus sp.]|uniref:histone deacetylase n=1 Tax=Satyrvirus sp. TaxID=2487771 RepID=A0A3G5AE59_9VIRU|nr:MAG: histone deacetylase [Satyrvirus sp.]
MRKVTIYYDKDSVLNHNPQFGTLENGYRLNINFDPNIVLKIPNHNGEHFKMVKKFDTCNPTIKYLLSEPFKQNFLQRIFRIRPKSFSPRNCHGCTMLVSDDICPICGTEFGEDNFYKYVHLIDNSVNDSDTTYITHTSCSAIMNATNLVCQMVEDMAKKETYNGFAVVRPPGHHASYVKSEGFCLINNIAICAEYAILLGFKKIFIFDFDAHHGNGTQNIFYRRNDVFYCSMHTLDAYPKTGHPEEIGVLSGRYYNLNIIVPKGVSDEAYVGEFKSKVLPAIIKYNPDLILLSAGFDGLKSDPMSIMNLTPNCYTEIIKSLTKLNIKIGIVLEGGYNVENLSICINRCIEQLQI